MSELGDNESIDTSKSVVLKRGSQKPISRRDFLKFFALEAAALTLGGCVSPREINEKEKRLPSDTDSSPSKITSENKRPQERFEEMNLSEFWNFYSAITQTTSKFGARSDGYYFNRIFNVCQQVAEGKIVSSNDTSLVNIRDGWGEKREAVIEDALTHIQGLQIQNYDTSGDPENFRQNQLTAFAEAFAPMAMALPKEIYLTSYSAQTMADQLYIVSFDQWGAREAWSRLIHEATHAADVWSERIQRYVTKEQFLEYALAYYQLADDLLTKWLESPDVETARDYWSGFIRGWGGYVAGNPDKSIPVIAGVENMIFNQEFAEESPLYRFIRVSWNVGRQIQAIRKKQEQNVQLTSEETNLLENADIQLVMSWALEETLHFLVSPPENTFFPEDYSAEELRNERRIARAKMNAKRIKTFSSFNIDPEQDLPEQIRIQLGIDHSP